MSLTIYTAAEAAQVMKTARQTIDAACSSGALAAVDEHPESSRRAWRIADFDLADWHRRGRPTSSPPDGIPAVRAAPPAA